MHHFGVHLDCRYVFLLFIRVYIVFMHCSSPTVLNHVPFVAFVLELCTVQCLLSVHVLHTTMYYLVVVYHASLYAFVSLILFVQKMLCTNCFSIHLFLMYFTVLQWQSDKVVEGERCYSTLTVMQQSTSEFQYVAYVSCHSVQLPDVLIACCI